MADTNPNIRFMANNLASLSLNSFDFSSEVTGFPATNAFNSFRSSIWKTQGYFAITASNNQIYINDGSDKTASVPILGYESAASLCISIATALNGVSSGWGCTYDSAGGTYKFTITHSTGAVLKLSNQTNAIWQTIGYTSIIDTGTLTTFVATEQRNHTNEFITLDFGTILPVTFVAIISDVAKSFGLSSTATVTLEGNNINDFTSPPFSRTLTVNDQGIFQFFVETPQVSHRFWRLNIVDIYNSVQGPGLEIGNIYLGDFQTLTGRTLTTGFTDSLTDPSNKSETEGGVIFFDKRTKYSSFGNIPIRLIEDADKQIIKDVFNTVGLTEPFYIALDPLNQINNDPTEYIKYCVFEQEPTYTSAGSCFFNTVLNVRELI